MSIDQEFIDNNENESLKNESHSSEAEHEELKKNNIESAPNEDVLVEDSLVEPDNASLSKEETSSSCFSNDPEKDKGPKRLSDIFTEFLASFEKEAEIEEKIHIAIEFMRSALSQTGSPRFKDFWEGRRVCLPLFKDTINPAKRAQLWAEYIELSSEARRLKEILDEQSAFAAEQIELAIQALENDLDQYDALLQKAPEIEFPEPCPTIQAKKDFYSLFQKELQMLNTFASRVNALRKEVVRTEMRVRIKNKFFERLSVSGDKIFPRRKELIKNISDAFIADVQLFIDGNFQDEETNHSPLFALREEIKSLQSIAKLLTLNTHSFTETRLKLSECWDQVKRKEKDRKKEFAQKKQIFKQNFDLVMEKIESFAGLCREGNLTNDELNRHSDDILDFMHTVELGRDEVRGLRDEIQKARRIVYDKARDQEQERERKEREAEILKREKISDFKNHLHQVLQNSEPLTTEELVALRDTLFQEYEQLPISRSERQIFDRIFKQFKDAINEKKEKAMMNLSEDELHSLELLKDILNQRKLWRVEIKNQLNNYRKAIGGSGLDFEKAMMYNELVESEKIRLEKANASIEEIEEKIEQFENR